MTMLHEHALEGQVWQVAERGSILPESLHLDAPVPVPLTAASSHQDRCRGQCNEQFANTIFNIDEPCSCWSPSLTLDPEKHISQSVKINIQTSVSAIQNK